VGGIFKTSSLIAPSAWGSDNNYPLLVFALSSIRQNLVAAGQWRALALPKVLRGKISPDLVYSIDPAQVYPGAYVTAGNSNFSYVRPSLTVLPYAIANNLPFYLISGFEIFANNSPSSSVIFSSPAANSPIRPCYWPGSTNTSHR